jgi:phospholipid N-methyltransferase
MTSSSLPAGRHEPTSPDWWLFLRKFLREGRGIAALAPSSRWIARAAVRGIDFDRAGCVVELGAGTGPITRALLRGAAGTACRVLVIERDPDFCQRLRRRFPDAEVVNDDALVLDRILAERGLSSADHVISGLPFPSFAPADRARLLELLGQSLAPEGTFRQLTHMPWVYRSMYRRHFAEVRFRLVPLNLPPGGVYICRGLKGQWSDVPALVPQAQGR